MSCDEALDKLSEKLNSRLLVQEEHGVPKQPGLERVKQAFVEKRAGTFQATLLYGDRREERNGQQVRKGNMIK